MANTNCLNLRTQLAASIVAVVISLPCLAVDISVRFDAANSSRPSFDPNGTRLMAMMQRAASHWGDIIEDGHDLSIDVIYGTLETADAAVLTTSDGFLADTALIRFSDTREWYFDPTPNDDSEFDLSETLFGDGAGGGFNTAGPGQPMLEISYRGQENGSDPNASLGFDALSTAMHEIGHVLGVTSHLIGARVEYADGDYDLPASMTGGIAMGAQTTAGDEPFHLLAAGPLMSGIGADKGERRYPSATDILSAAAASGWTEIDLPRQEFVLGSDFNSPGGWMGGQVPDSADTAHVRSGTLVNMSGNARVRSLSIDGESTLSTQANTLTSVRDTLVDGNGKLIVGGFAGTGRPRLNTTTLTIGNNGEATLFGNDALIDASVVKVGKNPFNNDASLRGDGTVDVSSSFVNNGLVSSGELLGGHLTITASSSTASIDLDGEQDRGRVDVIVGDLTVSGPLTDIFSSSLVIGDERTMTAVEPWEFDGTLRLRGRVNQPAKIKGAHMGIRGSVIADGSDNRIESESTFGVGTSVVIPDADDKLTLGSSTNFVSLGGGSFFGDGTLALVGQTFVQVGASASISVKNLDWDGVGSTDTRILPGATLNVNVGTIENAHEGSIRISGGNLAVTTDAGKWGLNGFMQVGGPTATSSIAGDTLHVRPTGRVQFQDESVVTAPLLVDGELQFAAGTHRFNDLHLTANGRTSFQAGHLIADEIRGDAGFGLDGGRLTFQNMETSNTPTPGVFLNSAGTFAPGDSIGSATINGGYTHGLDAVLEIDIAGRAGGEYDTVSVSDLAFFLGGELELYLQNDFLPASNDTFAILNSDRLLGELGNVPAGERLATADGLGSFVVNYGSASSFDPNSIVLSDFLQVAAALCGDFDSDGDVDTADRTILTQNWTGASIAGTFDRTFEQGDCDSDGDVDTADQTGLLQNWTGAQQAAIAGNADESELVFDRRTGRIAIHESLAEGHSALSDQLSGFALGGDKGLFDAKPVDDMAGMPAFDEQTAGTSPTNYATPAVGAGLVASARPSVVPEPTSLVLLLLGLIAIGPLRLRGSRAAKPSLAS